MSKRNRVLTLLELIRLRNGHPAFEGTLSVELIDRNRLRMSWHATSSSCSLDVDVSSGRVTVDQGLPGDTIEELVG